MSSPTARRRQRSTRLTVAVSLLTCAAVLVTVAFLGDAAWFQAVAAVSSVVLGAAATRITHSELLQSRRDAARDRAEQAMAYRELTEQRTAEHLTFSRAMQARSDQQELALTELESALGGPRSGPPRRPASSTPRPGGPSWPSRRAAHLGTRLEEAEERAAEAVLRVSELEQELDVARAELLAWEAAPQRMRA